MPNTPKGLTYPSNASPVAVPADLQELATDVDGLIVPNTGGTYTGSVSFTQSPSVPTPTSSLHAVNKTYADTIDAKFAKVGNLLSVNQASVETDTSGFYTGGAATISRSTTYSVIGSASLAATSTSSGTYGINVGSPSVLSSMPPVVPGYTYTATAKVRCTTSRLVTPRIYWRDSAGNAVSAIYGAGVTVDSSGFREIAMTATAPSGAAYAIIEFIGPAAGAGEVLYFDTLGFWRGVGGIWSPPGSQVLGVKDGISKVGNLLTKNQATCTDTDGSSGVGEFYSYNSPTISSVSGWDGNALQVVTTSASSCEVYVSGIGRNGPNPAIDTLLVSGGEWYTFTTEVKQTVGTRAFTVAMRFFDSSTSHLGSVASTAITPSSSPTRVVASGKAPGGSAFVRVTLIMGAGTVGNTFQFDKMMLVNGVGGEWTLPDVSPVGQSQVLSNGAVHLSGTGSPESVISAAPGSTYLQTDSVVDVKGWIRWIKATGTGNTGWIAGPEADTGWRNVSADLGASWAVATADGAFHVRRVGNTVTLRAHIYNGTLSSTMWTAPSGFRPSKNTYFHVSQFTAGAAIGGGYWGTNGEFQRYTSNAAAYNTITVVTNDAWPSSLPGTAA